MAAVFTWVPSVNFRKQNKARVLTAAFGDGYSQRSSDGINNINMEWQLSFINQPLAIADAIEIFLRTAGIGGNNSQYAGVQYFLWTPIGEVTQYKVVCDTYDIDYTSHISRTINASFRRVYDL
jgi:phage-related protein